MFNANSILYKCFPSDYMDWWESQVQIIIIKNVLNSFAVMMNVAEA